MPKTNKDHIEALLKRPSLQSRRDALKLGLFSATAAALSPLSLREARAQANANGKLLFVITAFGGGSIIDSLIPVVNGSGGNSFAANEIDQAPNSEFKTPMVFDNSIQGAIALGNQYPVRNFMQKHTADVVAMTAEVTSVNHIVAAKRAITGNNVNAGRTIMEAAAMAFGEGCVLPNANMSGGGYIENGVDPSVPASYRAEPISDAKLFPFATHGYKGVAGAPSQRIIEKARAVRRDLEDKSGFLRTFKRSSLVQRYRERRQDVLTAMEASDVITKLMLMQNSPDVPLTQYDLETSPDGATVLEKFPNLLNDVFESQAALSFLLARYGISASIAFGPGNSPVFESEERIINPPIAFDWSHNDHRGAQNTMWSRIFKTLDGLIDLLKATDHLGNPANGKMWDRSMIFIATEFGREKVSSGGSAHHLNNGNVLISPMLNGNRIYGGVDPNTSLTYGFDPQTGNPDPNRLMHEEDVYSAVCHAMGIDFPGRRDMPCMVRGA